MKKFDLEEFRDFLKERNVYLEINETQKGYYKGIDYLSVVDRDTKKELYNLERIFI